LDARFYDINEVCKMLGTTSRTLRFYEEKGIISSTPVPYKTRRQYTEKQIDHIKNVIVLRTIGLSVAQISELQKGQVDLLMAIKERRARIYALLDEKVREIHLLNEALAIIGEGGDIFEHNVDSAYICGSERFEEIVKVCSEAIVFGETDKLYCYFCDKMIEYMPVEAYEKMREDTLMPIGRFVSFEKRICDAKYPNVWFQDVKYELLNIRIKFVFYGEQISGLWLLYCEK